MDYIVDLPVSNGYDSIFVVVDRFTKQAHFIRAHKDDTAPTLAKHFLENIFRLHGLPTDIVSDRGSTFNSHFWRAFLKQLDIKPNLSTAFHPQSDGQTERINQTVEMHLRIFCDFLQTNWSDLLPLAEHAYNAAHHSTIGMSPFFANKGYNPRLSITLRDTEVPAANERLQRLQEVHEQCRTAIKDALEKHSFYANKKRKEAPPFEVGDKVWLHRRYVKTNRPSSKLDAKRLGPFKVLEKVGKSAFRLELPATMQIHPVFHVSLLEKYHANRHPERETPAPPDPVIREDGQPAYMVERILKSKYVGRGRNRHLEYFVHWEGYPSSEDSWILASDLNDDDQETIEFHTRYPDQPGYERLRRHNRSRGTRA